MFNAQVGVAAAGATSLGWFLIIVGFGLGTAVSLICTYMDLQ